MGGLGARAGLLEPVAINHDRSRRMMTSVLIVGGGPVGMTLALDLSSRGIDVVVAERRPADAEPSVRCGQISARSMEVFRRLGVADKLRGVRSEEHTSELQSPC